MPEEADNVVSQDDVEATRPASSPTPTSGGIVRQPTIKKSHASTQRGLRQPNPTRQPMRVMLGKSFGHDHRPASPPSTTLCRTLPAVGEVYIGTPVGQQVLRLTVRVAAGRNDCKRLRGVFSFGDHANAGTGNGLAHLRRHKRA